MSVVHYHPSRNLFSAVTGIPMKSRACGANDGETTYFPVYVSCPDCASMAIEQAIDKAAARRIIEQNMRSQSRSVPVLVEPSDRKPPA